MKLDSVFSSVVLPQPVPPLMRHVEPRATQGSRKSSIGRVNAL